MTESARAPAPAARLADVIVEEADPARWSPEVEHERRVAVSDLLEDNRFEPRDAGPGPWVLRLAVAGERLELRVSASADGREAARVSLALSGLHRAVKDYFTVCERYVEAIRAAPPSRIEALDMGRRAIHDDGARLLAAKLADRIRMDHDTARRLFTLVCALRMRG